MFEASLLFADQQATERTDQALVGNWLTRLNLKLILPYLLAITGLLWSSWGLWLLLSGGSVSAESQLVDNSNPINSDSIIVATDPDKRELVVDVSGAVVLPGIYSAIEGDRVADALGLAGGVTELADLTYLQSTLNLASRISDEQKIYVPFLVENQSLEVLPVTENSESASQTSAQTSINFASKAELVELPKIGEVTAEKIIAGRPYQSTNQLLTDKIVTESVWTGIKDQIKL